MVAGSGQEYILVKNYKTIFLHSALLLAGTLAFATTKQDTTSFIQTNEDSHPEMNLLLSGQDQTEESPDDLEKLSQESDSVPLEQTDIPKKSLDLEGLDHSLTQKWINYYLTPNGQKWLVKVLSNSIPYRPYIIEQLQANEMPMILQYLPIVESSYTPTAVSKVGATGMWQFMENSMAPLLKKNNWYDERRDPWKSTQAAIFKLKDNYNIFEDWAIAIAAYNCGNGAMRKALRNSKEQDFWYIAEHKVLRDQTIQYVPKLLAIAELIENAEYYGLIEIDAINKCIVELESQPFDYVTMSGMVSLKEISRITEIDEDTIKFLNTALFRNCTPAGEHYDLRLPAGTGENAVLVLKDIDSVMDAVIYTVTKGDSLWGISRRYGVTVTDLCQVNNIKENAVLSIGQKVIVPIFN